MRKYALTLISTTFLLLSLAACDEAPAPPSLSSSEDLSETSTRVEALNRTLENAQALRSIKRLQWAYGHYSELGLWYDFADLFADSGVGHYVQGDLNRDQIRDLFYDQVGQGRLGLATGRIYPHISFSPVVELDEDVAHAKGRFRILAMLGGYGGNATWFHGAYENAYVKEQGIWKLNEIANTAQISGSFANGLSASSKAPLDQPTFAFHYEPDQVGSIALAPPVGAANERTEDEIAETLASIQQSLNLLDDEAAIVNLQHRYGYYLDQHEWDKLIALFAEQSSFETDQMGVYLGKDSIRQGLSQGTAVGLAAGEVDEHILFQTYVSVAPDGLTAKARVDQLGMHGQQGESAQWSQGIYENSFIKEDGQWRIQSLHYFPRLITDYAKGWGLDAQAAAGPSADYPADAPPSEIYEIYPEFYIPAFHFVHPVTGRAPQYPEGDPAIGKALGFSTSSQTLSAAPTWKQGSDLQTTLARAEAQAQQAQAFDAVENLINAYAYYLDECMPQAAARLFAETGSNQIPGIGKYTGELRIAQALQMAYCPAGRQEGELTLHHVLQPVVNVSSDGQSATIVSRLWQIHVAGTAEDYYLLGQLDAGAVMENGQWQLVTLNTRYNRVAAIKEGWAHSTVNAELGYAAPMQMLNDLPPDLPANSPRLAPYP